jgi:hypothetical protein
MKKPTLLDKLRRFFDKKAKVQEAKRKQLKVLLKKLKKEETALREKLSKNKDAERAAHFERQKNVLHAQRKKGVALLRELGK